MSSTVWMGSCLRLPFLLVLATASLGAPTPMEVEATPRFRYLIAFRNATAADEAERIICRSDDSTDSDGGHIGDAAITSNNNINSEDNGTTDDIYLQSNDWAKGKKSERTLTGGGDMWKMHIPC
eukprot:5045337-Pyramimonas_sp.AAC.1